MRFILLKCLSLKCKVTFFLLFLLNCQPKEQKKTEYDILANYLATVHQYKLKEHIKTIFILSDNNCNICNKKTAEFMSQKIKNNAVLFLIISSGSKIDISAFPDKQENVLYDNPDNVENDFFYDTKVVYLNNNKIVKTLKIQASQIGEQLLELEERL